MPTTRCPPVEQLERLLEEALDDATQQSVARHVDGCAPCQALLDRLTEEGADAESLPPSMRRPPSAAPGTNTPDPFLTRLRQSPPPSGAGAADGAAAAAPGPGALPTIAGYEILSVLSRGGMGVVYKARQVGLNRLVALKMILSGAHAGPKGQARFLAEAEAVARLRHPHIVQIYDFGESSGCPYFALEYVEGGTLAQRLHGDPQPLEDAVRLTETLARAMHYAHQNDIVHRDLKPANILIGNREPLIGNREPLIGNREPLIGNREPLIGNREQGTGNRRREGTGHAGDTAPAVSSLFPVPCSLFPTDLFPKITDFGLAKRLDANSNGTQTGEVVGTPSYMAPEQAAGKAGLIGPATDVYALGAILYELLTGRPPFKGATALDTVVQVLHEEPARPARLRPDLPRDLEIITLKCLEKDPRRRYESAEALADELRRFRQGKPVLARPVGTAERAVKWARRHPLTATLLAVIVVVTALGFVGVTSQWQAAEAARDVAVAERRKARAALYYSRIAQSQLQWRVNDVTGSRQSLDKCLPNPDQEDRRGWEWYYLDALHRTDLFTLHHRRGGLGGAVAFRPDGRWVASVVGGHPAAAKEAGGEVRIWDAATGLPVRALAAPATAHRLAFSPDGTRLALAGTDGTVLVWDPAAGKELLRRTHHADLVAGIAFCPDGKQVASAGWDKVVKIWDATTGRVRRTLTEHTGRVQSVAYQPGGRLLVSASWDATVKIWDPDSAESVKTLRGHLGAVYAVAFSPNGRLLATAGSNGILKIWDVETWRVIQSLTGHAGAVLGVAFSPDSRYLAYGGGDATVRVWDVESGVERFIFRGHTAAVESVQFSPDGRRLVSASPAEAAAVKVWDLTRHPGYATFARTRGGVRAEVNVRDLVRRGDAAAPAQTGPDVEALAFQAQGKRLVSVTVGGTLQSWDAATGVLREQRPVAMSKELVSPAVLAAFSPDGAYLAARATEGNREDSLLVKVWDATTGAEVAALRGHTLPVVCVRFSADGRRLVSCGCDLANPAGAHEVKVWDVKAGKALATLPGRGQIFQAALSPDGRWLALARRDGGVLLVDWARPRRTYVLADHKGPVGAVVFSPDGRLLVSAGLEDRVMHFWDLAGLAATPRKAPHALNKLTAPPFLCDLAFSPDGRRLAGVSRDVVKLWDAATGHEVLTLRGAPQRHWDPAFNPRVLFSPDGKRLAATNWDETISLWEAEMPPDEAALARHRVERRRAADARGPLWHLQEAEDCAEHKNPAAARFHLHCLGDAPLPAPLQARKEQLVRRLDAPAPKDR